MNLKERFFHNCLLFTKDENLAESLWLEIEKKYSEKKRHYHNLVHLENMFAELDAVKDKISDFTDISFSVFYHDVIYEASSRSNEEESAGLAEKRLQKLNIGQDSVIRIFQQIIATKTHQRSDDEDTNYLLDADLSILGKETTVYFDYTKKIRKEYSIYPDIFYKPGRKKVLRHFLQLESIFKTDHFKARYEEQARENIRLELASL